MGAQLVALALARWTHVSDRAFRVLTRMALTALDEPQNGTPAGMYFGGRDLLVASLRRDGASDATQRRKVRRLLDELIDAGAIERAAHGRAGKNSVYRLTLLNEPKSIDEPLVDNPPVDNSQGGPQRPPEGGSDRPPQGGPQRPLRGVLRTPPRNHEEPIEELSEEDMGVLGEKVTPARVHSSVQPEEIPNDDGTASPAATDPPTCPRCTVWLDPDGACRNRQCPDAELAVVIPLRRTA